jgi:hypothetical protein
MDLTEYHWMKLSLMIYHAYYCHMFPFYGILDGPQLAFKDENECGAKDEQTSLLSPSTILRYHYIYNHSKL